MRPFENRFFIFGLIFGLVTIFFFEPQVGSSECVCVVCVSNVMAEVGSALASDAFLVAAAQDDLLLPYRGFGSISAMGWSSTPKRRYAMRGPHRPSSHDLGFLGRASDQVWQMCAASCV